MTVLSRIVSRTHSNFERILALAIPLVVLLVQPTGSAHAAYYLAGYSRPQNNSYGEIHDSGIPPVGYSKFEVNFFGYFRVVSRAERTSVSALMDQRGQPELRRSYASSQFDDLVFHCDDARSNVNYHTRLSIVGEATGTTNGYAQVSVGDPTCAWGGCPYSWGGWRSDTGGSGVLTGIPPGTSFEATLSGPLRSAPTDVPTTVAIAVSSQPISTGGAISGKITASLPSDGPVFDLPAGCTCNSLEGNIVDNHLGRPNEPPVCDEAVALVEELWPPNHTMRDVTIVGVVDPDGDPVTITVTGVTQDEPIQGPGAGNTCPDAVVADGQASVRAERSGGGNGRVYVISFTADDGQGGSCDGMVSVCVPHDRAPHANGAGVRALSECQDDGQTVNSLGTCPGHGPFAFPVTEQVDVPVEEVRIRHLRIDGTDATLEYSLPHDANVLLSVHDLVGRRVATLEKSFAAAGSHRVSWSTVHLPSGVYFYRLRAGDVSISRSVLILK